MADSTPLSISVVSHGQMALVRNLLTDLKQYCVAPPQIILTVNVPEAMPFDPAELGVSHVIHNASPKGFSANHNAAFHFAETPYFCVLNPDIRLTGDPFPVLIRHLTDRDVGAVAPAIVNPAGRLEDSARRFPTFGIIVMKALGKAPRLDYEIGSAPIEPDWLAGMFLLLRSATFLEMGGFDERYFLYYEDVDLNRRMRSAGYRVLLVPEVRV
ncbi:MAG TPA: glycosyltransferase, partial [Burkholderiales bacterium]|nr:glycosyltransferase [Burkholderiales bacterium]